MAPGPRPARGCKHQETLPYPGVNEKKVHLSLKEERKLKSLVKILMVLALVAVICLPGIALAATISYTDSIASTTTGWSDRLDFTQFNPLLGTLTQVELSLSSGMDTTLTVTNTGTKKASGSAWTTLNLSVADGGGYITYVPTIGDFPSKHYGYSALAIGGSKTSDPFTNSVSSDNFYSAALVLAEFTGTGSTSLLASTTAAVPHWSVNNGAQVSVSTNTHASLDGTVTYTYTPAPPPVPIPGSVLLLGFGLVGLGLLRLRKRTKA
jgi:hypothetical protein